MKLFKLELTPPVRALSAFALMLGALTASAAGYTWDGGGDGTSWTDPKNWGARSTSYPKLNDTATFPKLDEPIVVELPAEPPAYYNWISLNADGADVTFKGSAPIQVNSVNFPASGSAKFTVDGMTVTISNSEYKPAATARIKVVNGGAIVCTAKLTPTAGSEIALESGGTLQVDGVFTASALSSLTLSGGSSLVCMTTLYLRPLDTVIAIDDSVIDVTGICYIGDTAPGGGTIQFRGANPLLRLRGNTQIGYSKNANTMTAPVVFDFMVPEGGYVEPPFQFLNATGANSAFKTYTANKASGKLVVNAGSPALAAAIPVDTMLALSTKGFYRTLTDITDTTAALRYVDAAGSATEPATDAAAVGIRAVVGSGASPVVSTVAASKIDLASTTVFTRKTLAASAFVTALSTVAASSELRLMVGETEGAATVVASAPVKAQGVATLSWTAPFGCLDKTYAMRLVLVDLDASGNVISSSATDWRSLVTFDVTTYTWTGEGGDGKWSNPANWADNQGGDSAGYPHTADATAKFTTDAEVLVDGIYGAKLDFGTVSINVRLRGEGAEASKITCPSFIRPSTSSTVTFDNMSVASTAAVNMNAGKATIALRNGAKFSMGDLTVGGTSATTVDCLVDLEGGSDLTCSNLKVNGGLVRICDSTITQSASLILGSGLNNADVGIRFEGKNPKLYHSAQYDYFYVGNATVKAHLDFVVPKGGFESAPFYAVDTIAKVFGYNNANPGSAPVTVNVSAENAALMALEPFTTDLIRWRHKTTTTVGIPKDMVTEGLLPTADEGHAFVWGEEDGRTYPTSLSVRIANVYCNALEVLAEPEQWGEPSPGYGSHAGLANGELVELRAPDAMFDIAAETRARFAGWRLFRADAEGQFVLEDEAETNQYDYVHESGATCRFEWKLKRVYPLTLAAVGDGTSDLYVNGSLAGTGIPIWFDEGSEVEIVAMPQSGSRFSGWSEDCVRTATHRIAMSGPVAETACSMDRHTYASDSYVRDGLVLQLDGIDNAGFGLHDGSATGWKDLSGNYGTIKSANANAVWNWGESSLPISAPEMQLQPSVALNFQHVTFEAFSDRLAEDSSGCLFWASATSGRATWEISKKAGSNPTYGAQACGSTLGYPTYYDGSHVVRIDGTAALAWQSDESYQTQTISNANPDEDVANLVYIGRNYSVTRANSRFYAFRAYNRALSDDEIRWNAAVDRARFSGGSIQSGTVTVAASPEEVAVPAPGYGKVEIGLTTNNVFVLGGLVTDDFDGARVAAEFHGSAIRHVFAGYDWTTGLTDKLSGSGTEESFILNEPSLFNSVTWKFVKQYRTIVATDEGGTVTVSPGVTGTCVTNWAANGTIEVSAAADTKAGYRFFKWTGDTDGIADITVPTITVPVKSRDLRATYTWEDPKHEPVTTAWKPDAATGDWDDASNWDNGVPMKGDTVVISNVAANVTINFSKPTAELGLLAIGGTNGKTVTLVSSDWSVRISADVIDLGAGAVVTCTGPYSWGQPEQRVYLGGGKLIVREGARVHADERGYVGGQGYSYPNGKYGNQYIGGSYGGLQGHKYNDNCHTYGSVEEPVNPGSGGGEAGGGAIRLDFTGDIVVDGEISACGRKNGTTYCSGSGGGIWIDCRTISGTGFVKANARDPWRYPGMFISGGGGRVAVHYNPAAQANTACGVRFEARGGSGAHDTPERTVTQSSWENNFREFVSRPGTIWFSDNLFLERAAAEGVWRHSGVWKSPVALTKVEFPNGLEIDRAMLEFDPGVDVEVTGDLKATGFGFYARRENGLAVRGADVRVSGNIVLQGARLEMREGGSLSVGGNLVEDTIELTTDTEGSWLNGGEVYVHAAADCEPGAVGATVSVGGTWTLSTNSVAIPVCDSTNGAYVALAAHNVNLQPGSMIDAIQRGYRPKFGPGVSTATTAGASHGGKGGANNASASNSVAEVYGSVELPLEAGSGSYPAADTGFIGGGVVSLNVSGRLTLNGVISADANVRQINYMYGKSAASGGSICIKAHRLKGNGVTGGLYARGGSVPKQKVGGAVGSELCAGGGGRIAVWCGVNAMEGLEAFKAGNISVEGGRRVVYNDWGIVEWCESAAGDGTVYFGDLPMPGLMLLVR